MTSSTYVRDLVRFGVPLAAYEAAANAYPFGSIPAGPWSRGLAAYAKAERTRVHASAPKAESWAHEIAFQREMLAEIKLNPGQAVIMHDDHTGKPLTRRDVFNQYSVLLHVCADKNVPE